MVRVQVAVRGAPGHCAATSAALVHEVIAPCALLGLPRRERVIEHRLERVAPPARAAADALEPALHGGEHGAEQLRHLGYGAEEEAFILFFEA